MNNPNMLIYKLHKLRRLLQNVHNGKDTYYFRNLCDHKDYKPGDSDETVIYKIIKSISVYDDVIFNFYQTEIQKQCVEAILKALKDCNIVYQYVKEYDIKHNHK